MKDVNVVGKANGTVQEVKDKWENLHSTKNKKKNKTEGTLNFSKDGFHHQPLALDEKIFLLGNDIVGINDSFIFALCSLTWVLSMQLITPGNPPLS